MVVFVYTWIYVITVEELTECKKTRIQKNMKVSTRPALHMKTKN